MASMAASSEGDASPVSSVSVICSRAGSASAACMMARRRSSEFRSGFIESILTELVSACQDGCREQCTGHVVAAAAGRVARQRVPDRGGDRFRYRRAAAVPGANWAGAAGERGGDRGRAVRGHLDVRAGVGRPFQPGGVVRGRRVRRAELARCHRVSAGAGGRVHWRRRGGELDVRPARSQHLHQAPGYAGAFPVGDRRDSGPDAGDLCAGPVGPASGYAGGGRGLYRRGVFLHLLDQLRQSGDCRRPDVFGHLRRYSPLVGAELRRCRDRGRRPGRGGHPRAVSRHHPGPGRGHRRPSPARSGRARGRPVRPRRRRHSARAAWPSRPTTKPAVGEPVMHLVMIGGSDAGISAALRARELDPGADVTVVVADAYPNFSICGIPYYLSGEVARWQNLAHRTIADLEAAGMWLRLDTTARRIDVPAHKLLITSADGKEELLGYDKLIVGTGAVPVRPPIGGLDGPDALGPDDGVHLLHSMGDTFAVMRTLEEAGPASAVIVGAGYIGLEMADALTVRGLAVTQMERLPEVLPTVDPELGALVRAQLEAHGVTVRSGTAVRGISAAEPGASGRLYVEAASGDGTASVVHADLVLVVTGVRPETALAVSAGASLGAR